jgi:thiamine-phosphate pyrophosphorylase
MTERPSSAGRRRPVPRLLAISDRRRLEIPFAEWVAGLAVAGVDGVQLREKALDDRGLLALARTARALLPAAALLVNGRLDVALAAGADGVHLPADGLPAAPLVAWAARLGRRPLVGRSTHSLAEVAAARDEGVDYVAFGPVFATPGKGPPLGTAALAAAARLGVPVLALGGLEPRRVAEAIAAGAHGVAAIRAFRTREGAAAMVAASAAAQAPPGC